MRESVKGKSKANSRVGFKVGRNPQLLLLPASVSVRKPNFYFSQLLQISGSPTFTFLNFPHFWCAVFELLDAWKLSLTQCYGYGHVRAMRHPACPHRACSLWQRVCSRPHGQRAASRSLWVQSQWEESCRVGLWALLQLGWICFHLPCILDLESEPRSDWQCFHAFFVKYTLLTKNGLRRNTSADARRASLEKGKKMMKTLSTSLEPSLLELLCQMIWQWKSLLMPWCRYIRSSGWIKPVSCQEMNLCV